jgi:ABC-type branched-subunit amino acid transport system substrate-binding protein
VARDGASGGARDRAPEAVPDGSPAAEPDTAPPPGSWFAPPGLSALIAERSAVALALPDPEPLPATLAPDEDGGTSSAGLTRRRLLTAGGAGAVLVTGGSTAEWLAGRRSSRTGGSGAGSGGPPTYTIGLHADLSGPGRGAGLAHQRGVRLAVADHNARTDTTFRLVLRTEDDAGDPRRALRAADRLGADPDVIAAVGPTGDVLATEVVQRYGEARLPLVVVAAGSTTASETPAHLCVTRPFDRMLIPGLLDYVVRTRPAERVLLVQDRDGTALGGQLGSAFRDTPPAGATLIEHALPRGDAGFGAAARKARTSRADAVVFASGDASRAARLATALADAGFTSTRVAAGPALGPAFLDGAGKAADGWVFAEAYADPAALPSARTFTDAHRKRFGAPPATWAAEAYDAVGLIARAAGTTSASGKVRGGMAQRLLRTEHRGIVRPLAFRPSIRQVRYENGIFLYRIEKGRPRFLGPFGEV